uniref:Leucine-rich repeat-containing N-terminal plant-type domain-containing protein n=1 Tax=Populus alba TaxID=43335 RepID=A0A4U5N965_POPAL|nr:hypothetical protein D5086_0000271660 [Populus alba]
MWVWMLLALLTLVGEWYGRCDGCMKEERSGLLEIKSSIYPYGAFSLRNWVDSKEDISDCCEWGRIKCDNTTRRVIELNLWAVGGENFRGWVLNASLLLPFKELQSLDLSHNAIGGCYENQGFEVLPSKLRKLNVLDLSHNLFTDDTILSCLAGLSSLKSLDLRYNYILTGSGFEVLSSRLKKLENLDLSGNSYIDSIFSSLTGLSSLKFLDLSDNELTGSAGFYGLEVLSSQLRKLERLDLSYNSFNDSIVPHLRGLSSLKSLNLSGNMLSGSTTLNGLRKLEPLSLNELTIIGITLLQSLGALPSLKTLSLRANNLSGTSISQG